MDKINIKYPTVNPTIAPCIATLDKLDRVIVRLKRRGAKYHLFFKPNAEADNKLSKTILKSNGPTVEEVVKLNEGEISKCKEKVRALQTTRESAEIDRLERENEEVEQRMSLRDRINVIFKKYGFIISRGAIIDVIISILKSGLTTLGKGVGNTLKTIGKMLREILPDMVGAIASIIFRTAGEVINLL